MTLSPRYPVGWAGTCKAAPHRVNGRGPARRERSMQTKQYPSAPRP
jgi:hypothetical protein